MSNELLPYAMRELRPVEPKGIAIAHGQLASWRIYARRWCLLPELRHTERGHMLGEGIEQLHLVCYGLREHCDQPMPLGPCGTSIFTLFDGGNFLQCDIETLDTLVVAHIRNVHREMEELVYNGQ
jgi:hypothetical protein